MLDLLMEENRNLIEGLGVVFGRMIFKVLKHISWGKMR